MNLSPAYLLVFHGSRDSRTKLGASQLAGLLAQSLENKPIVTQRKYLEQHLPISSSIKTKTLEKSAAPTIGTAALELSSLSLHQNAIKFAFQARQNGDRIIKVVPLFLSPGVHVSEDIPAEIERARKEVGREICFQLSSHIGKYSGIVRLLANKFARLPADGRVLFSHGSRLAEANARCETLAAKLDAQPAYWVNAPDCPNLERQVVKLIDRGCKRIAIVPYFLFPGRITSAIASKVKELQAAYPEVELILDRPLGATSELAELIVREVAA